MKAEGVSCPQACSNSHNSQAYYFASAFNASDPAMYACSVSTPAAGPTPAGVLTGYQANGKKTCTVVQGDQVVVANDFSCLCQVRAALKLQWQLCSRVLFFRQTLTPPSHVQDSSHTSGIDLPTSAGCSGSCTSIAGNAGQSLLTDAGYGNFGCVPATEQGLGNRMGTAVGNTCYAALDGAVHTFTSEAGADGFSCLCQFQVPEDVTTAG